MTLQAELSSFNFASLIADPIFADCVIKSRDGHEFKLHRAILSTRCDVFKAMFTADMKEGILKVVELPESKDVLESLFTVIYEGKFEGSVKACLDVTVALQKYLMLSDHEKLLHLLDESLCVGNAIEILIAAHEHEYEELKGAAVTFIELHIGEMRRHPSWELLIGEPELLELMDHFQAPLERTYASHPLLDQIRL